MSFTQKSTEKFSTVFDKSEYQSTEPVVKVQYVQKGSNLVFGRTLKGDDVTNLIYVGKVSENTPGRNFLNSDVWLDTTFPHVIYITGTRGSGKSFDLGVLLEGISDLSESSTIQSGITPITSILIDTQSQFWTLKYKPRDNIPQNKGQLEELARWNIPANELRNCTLYLPKGSDPITGDEREFTLSTAEVKHEEWCALINEDAYSPQGHILARTVESLRGNPYSIEDMIVFIGTAANWPNVAESSRNAVRYKLDDYRRTGLFSKRGLEVKELLVPGRCNVFLLRDIRNEDKAILTALIARQLFTTMGEHHKRMKVQQFFKQKGDEAQPLPSKVWLVIDEAHVVAPSDRPSPARDALVEYVKRGRDAGLSLVLATQQPSAIDDRILSQVNITFSHRLSFQSDIQAAVNRIPTKLLGGLKLQGVEIKDFGEMLRCLDAGECFLGDHGSSRVMMMKIRPRVTSHGGYSPI